MKKIICLLFVVSGLLNAQQKPFAYWHSAWSNTPQLPANFIANANAATDDLLVNATIFYRSPVDFDSILVVAKVGSAPSNRLDGIQLYKGLDTAAVQAAVFTDASFTDQSLVYASIYLRSIDGNWSSTKTDTAFFGVQTQLTTPTLVLTSGSGSITVDADDLDGNATHLLIQQRSFQNHTSIHRDGSRFKDSLLAVGNLPVTFTGRYYDEVWHFKIAAVNGADTSDFTTVDSSWAVNTVGDTIWYAASATGNGSGSDSSNAKLYSVTNIQNDIFANVPGRHIKLKNGDTFSSASRILLAYTQAWSGRSFAPIVVEGWNTTASYPVMVRTTSGEIIYVERGNHITFKNIHFAGSVSYNVPATYHADNFRFINCRFIGTGSGADGAIPMFLAETNVVAYDSVNRGYADSFYVYNCLFQNIYSNNDAIGSSSGGVDWVIYRNVVANIGTARGQDGIDVGYGLRVVIAYNKIYNTWNNGIKIMAQRSSNHDALVCYNEVIGNNMSGDGNFAFDIRTTIDCRFFNNSGTGFGYGLPAETSWPDNTHNGALNDNSTYPVIAFQGLGNHIYNNLYVGGSGTGYSGWIIHGGKNIMFTYPGGDTTRATWGPGRDDWGRWYLNYSSWHHNLYWNPGGGVLAQYYARHWPVTGNGSITWSGSAYNLSIGTHSWIPRGMEDFGTGYSSKFFSNVFAAPRVVDSSYTNDSNRGSLQPTQNSPAIGVGTFNGMAVDLAWQPVPDTLVSIGAYQNPYVECASTNHFTTAGITFENNDFLVQQNGIKNVTITGHTALQGVDSVRLALYKNYVLFMSDTEFLTPDACDSSTFLVSIDIPADTCLYSLRLYKDGTIIDTVGGLRVGNAYLVSGQSNASQDVTGYWDSTLAAIGTSRWLESNFGWTGLINATSGSWSYQYIGVSWAILADSLIKKQGIPVLIINGAVGGTSITSHLGGDANYTNLLSRVQAVNQDANGWTKKIWIQAETEGTATIENYPIYFDSLVGLWNNFGTGEVWVGQLGMHNCLYLGDRTFEMQRKLGENNINATTFSIAGFSDKISADGCHFFWNGYRDIGTWLYRQEVYGSSYLNPTVDSIRYTEADSTIRVYFDQNIIYTDSSNHNDYWSVDGDLQRVASASSFTNVISLVIEDSPADVDYLGYLNRSTYIGGGLYRGKFLRNANRVAVNLFDSLTVNTSGTGGVVMSNPTFTATFGSDSTLRFQGTFDADTDTARINGKRIAYNTNAYEDTVYLVRLSSGALDTTITGSWYNDTTYYFRCSTIGDSSGTPVTTFAQDTARVPAAGGGGGGDYPYTADLIGLYDEREMTISNWGDQSGNNYDLLQATSGSQPTLQTSALNGFNGLRFDGTNDYLTDNTGSPGTNTHAQPFTVYVVYRQITRSSDQESIIGWHSDGTSGLMSVGTGVFAGSNAYGVPGISTTNNVPYVAKIVVNGATSELLVAGVDSGSGNIGTLALNSIIVGQSIGWFAGYEAANCEVYHLSIHSTAHSDGLSGVIVAYLRSKYGL